MGSILARHAFPFVCMVTFLLAVAGCGGSAGTSNVADATAGSAHFEAVAAPAGVAPELWDQLTAELARVLRETPPRAVSTPPAGEAGAAALSYFEPTSTLSWLYQNAGDYNQDGLVGVSDLTPLGQHFGEESPGGAGEPFPAESLGAAIDGNGDGLIGISDITPIGQNFGVRVEGYRVYVAIDDTAHPPEPDGPNGAGTTWLGSMELGEGDASAGRLRFYHQVVPTQAEQYYWVRPYHGEEDGAASNAVQVIQPPPQAPVAALSANGNTETLAHIVWDAAASHDPDGGIVRWEWDFDGDGVFEHDSEGAASVDFYYYEAGDYSCTLRVTDGDLMTDETTETVHVTESATWHETIADEQLNWPDDGAGGMRYPPVLLDVAGTPGIFYERLRGPDIADDIAYDLCFVRGEDAQGLSWNAPAPVGQITTSSSTGSFFGAAGIVEGRPAAAYTYEQYDEGGHFLSHSIMFTRALDAEGSNWPAARELFISDIHLDTMSPRLLTNVDGRVAIVGAEAPFAAYNCILAENPTGSVWGDPYDIPEYLDSRDVTLGAVNGVLGTVRFENDEDLLYKRALDFTALDWAEPVLVDQLEKVGGLADLIEVDGMPAVVYYDDGLGGLKYRRALDAQGAAWGPLVVLTTQAQGKRQVTTVIDNRPAVLFEDRIDDQVKFVSANDPQGKLWGFPTTITAGEDISLRLLNWSLPNATFASVSGLPSIAHIIFFRDEEENPGFRMEYVAYY